MHASPLELLVIEVEFNLLDYVHCIPYQHAHLILWAIMHGNALLVVLESRPILLWVIHMKRCVIGAYIAWNALPCQVLSSAAVKPVFAGRYGWPAILSADRPAIDGRWIILRPVTIVHGRWPIPSAGGDPQHSEKQPWDLCSLQRSRTVKAEAACAWQWHPRRIEHASHWTLYPRLFTAFIRLVNLLIN